MQKDEVSEKDIPGVKQIFNHWICSAIVYGIIILIFNYNNYYSNMLTGEFFGLTSKKFFNILYIEYLLISPIILFLFKPVSLWHSHTILICKYFRKIFCSAMRKNVSNTSGFERFIPDKNEAFAISVILIKMFFGAFIINELFILSEVVRTDFPWTAVCVKNIIILNKDLFQSPVFFNIAREELYKFGINILLLVDLFCFSFGYLTESDLLNNKIKSVDLTPAGIFFCLACYPPFNDVTGAFLGGYIPSTINVYDNPDGVFSWILKSIYFIFVFIYVAASVALFTKAGNLTNRGIVDKWPYSVVRHPAYVCKILFWSVPIVPMIFVNFRDVNFSLFEYIIGLVFVLLNIFATTIIYYFRAITEERHLLKDPDYVQYCKKVKYRFIPYIW